MDRTTVILGAGFSAPAKVPVTSRISERFLEAPENSRTPSEVNDRITSHLEGFWQDVFGYQSGASPPTFEDHFTVVDLAANMGHNLGPTYSPATLRAVRRMSIHRVLDILNTFKPASVLRQACRRFSSGDNAIVSMNWDLVVENHWPSGSEVPGLHYGIDTLMLTGNGEVFNRSGIPLIKLHGSGNWHYCDSCQRLVAGHPGTGKTALELFTYLEPGDFRRLRDDSEVVKRVEETSSQYEPRCPVCGTVLTARIGTFSYSKSLDFLPFQALKAEALRQLVRSRQWLFIGYSLPASDYEFRHLLKAAELARGSEDKPQVRVVLKGDSDAEERFRRFFGRSVNLCQSGVEGWMAGACR